MPKKLKGDPLEFFNIQSISKHQKKEERHFGEKKISKKVPQSQKNCEGRLWDFSTFCRKLSKKMQGDPLREICSKKKCCSAERGEPLVSPGMVCYAKK